MRPYRLTGRIQNNRLWKALCRAFPRVMTQAEAAAAVGISATQLSALLTMRWWPGLKRPSRDGKLWAKDALVLAESVGETPEFLFDPALYGRGAVAFSLEVEPRQLATMGCLALPPGPDEALERREEVRVLNEALASLPARDREILTSLYGLEDGRPKTLLEIGEACAVTRERIRQIEIRALRKLRRGGHALRLRGLLL